MRLALEEAGAPYVDVAREREERRRRQGADGDARGRRGRGRRSRRRSCATATSSSRMSPTSSITSAPKLGLAPDDEASRVFARGLQLTITDLVAEAHDTHHPISTDLYYEDQKDEAKARAAAFLSHRAPKYLGYFERVLNDNPAGPTHAVGDAPHDRRPVAVPGLGGPGLRLPARVRRRRQALSRARRARGVGRGAPEHGAPTSPRSAAFPSTNRAYSATTRSSTRRRRRDAGRDG